MTAPSRGPRTSASGSSRHPSATLDSNRARAGSSVGLDITQRAKEAYEDGEAEEGPSVDTDTLGSIGTEQDGMFLNVRFEHQETDEGHVIVTGRKGELLKCEDEPIHIPGAIQDFGVLIAVEQDDEGNYLVVQASEVSRGARAHSELDAAWKIC
jgi:hypothetical protein